MKEYELILLHYIIETANYKLGIGWQEEYEISRIKTWEEISEIGNILSENYSKALNRFELRGFTEVSEVTAGGNPKEVRLQNEISSQVLDLPTEVIIKINEAVKRNYWNYKDNLPF